jgi:stress responsive alpha/beta barrel protein
MITHLVLMTPRPDLSAADRDALIAAFTRAARGIPEIRGVRIGRRVRHGAGYEQMSAGGDYLAAIDFDDIAALQAYLRHPAHDDLGRMFGVAFSEAAVYDFEVGGVERLADWRLGSRGPR